VSFERIHWPFHAERRLQDRHIRVEEVEDTIRAPDQRVADPTHRGQWIAQKRLEVEGRPTLLRVFYADAGGGRPWW
jgi:hypothetical protein